tara:strand:- start:157 stop:2241 length:2085 start_codon:yes stop_codon:yes gene_type:complete
MKKHFLFIGLLIFSCNPSTNENKTLDISETTPITQEVTTTIPLTTTSTSVAKYNEDILVNAYTNEVTEQYLTDWPALLNITITEIKTYRIEALFEGVNLKNILIVFNNGCIFESGGNNQFLFPNSKCDKKYTEEEFKKNVKLNHIQLTSKSINLKTQKPYIVILNSKDENGNNLTTLPNGYQPCCHKFDLSLIENQLFQYFEKNFKTTTTCEFSNELILKLTTSESSNNDGIVSSGEVKTSTYSLRNIPYAELISVNKNNGIITSIDVCHNKLEQIEIISLKPYCFYRIKDITYSSTPVLETLLLPTVLPNNKDECIQESSNSLFKGSEVKFMTRTKSPSMSTNVEENGTVSFYRSQTTTEKCCIYNTFVDIKYGTTTTTTTTVPQTTTTVPQTTTTLPSADDVSPSWPNKEVSITNINTDYVEVLWNTAEDNVNVAGYLFYLNGTLWDYYERINDNNSIYLNDLNPNTTYNLEIYAYDDEGNVSSDNPKISFTTEQISSAVSGGVGGSSNVGGIPSNLTTISSLSGIKYSPIYIYPFNGYMNGLQEFTPRFDVRDENCEALEVKFKTSKGYVLSDYIYIYSGSYNEGCFLMDKYIEIGYTYEAFVREEYLNRNGQGICDLWKFEEITIIYTNGRRLSYFRDGSVGYYENYVLKGLGNHDFNFFSEFDFETVNFSDTSDPNWEYRKNQMVSCES